MGRDGRFSCRHCGCEWFTLDGVTCIDFMCSGCGCDYHIEGQVQPSRISEGVYAGVHAEVAGEKASGLRWYPSKTVYLALEETEGLEVVGKKWKLYFGPPFWATSPSCVGTMVAALRAGIFPGNELFKLDEQRWLWSFLTKDAYPARLISAS